jgi:Lar family restriction alleviation protein
MAPDEEARAVAMFEREPDTAPVTDALLPCPFCGRESLVFATPFDDEEQSVIRCIACNADGPHYGDEDSTSGDEAAKLWNTRPMQAAKPVGDSNTKIVKLRAELEELYRREPSTDQPKIRRSIINETGPSIIGRLQQIDHLQRYHIACLEHALAVKPVVDSEVAEVLRELRSTAAMLQQNSEGCAANHHGGDFNEFGMPGWLVDTQTSIDRAAALLAKLDRKEGEGLPDAAPGQCRYCGEFRK